MKKVIFSYINCPNYRITKTIEGRNKLNMEITIRLSVSKQEFNDFIINMIIEDIKSKSSESFPENGIYEGFEYRVDKNNDFKQEKVTINKLAENSVLKFTIYYQNDEKFEVSFLFEEINQNEIKVT